MHLEIPGFSAIKRFVRMTRWSVRWMRWWYAAIALGFLLLAIVHVVTGDAFWLIAIRLVIAGGFAFLSWMEFHAKDREKR